MEKLEGKVAFITGATSGIGETTAKILAHRGVKVVVSGHRETLGQRVVDPRVPFGGIKSSGFGRELSRYGMLEFANIRSVRFYDQLIHEHHVE